MTLNSPMAAAIVLLALSLTLAACGAEIGPHANGPQAKASAPQQATSSGTATSSADKQGSDQTYVYRGGRDPVTGEAYQRN